MTATEMHIHNSDLDAEFPADNRPSHEEGDGDRYRTILEIWREVLKPVTKEKVKKVFPQWANRIVTTYPEISFKNMNFFRDVYYFKIEVLSEILNDLIHSDDECLKRISAEEDAQLNGSLYREVLTQWQKQFLQWELRWDSSTRTAAVELATLAEVHKMFFDDTGLISLLDQINLEFTDADREALAAELNELKDEVVSGE